MKPIGPAVAPSQLRNLPLAYVVVLNWNGISDTIACLQSLAGLTYPNVAVLVVDNGSTDDSVQRLRGREIDCQFELIETGRNLGFAEGNNVGIRHALDHGAEFVLLLNNDTVVDPDMLSAFVRAAQGHPDGGIFSGKIYYFDHPTRLWYAGARWHHQGQYFAHDAIGEEDTPSICPQVQETDYASGCAFFMRASMLQAVGLLDPKYFLTYEESDLCYRARALGFKVMVAPEARLWHKVSASFGGVDSPLQLYFYARNILLWGERHLPRREYWSLVAKTTADALRMGGSVQTGTSRLRQAYWGLAATLRRVRRGGHDPAARARFLGLRDYLLRRFGDCPDEVRHLRMRR